MAIKKPAVKKVEAKPEAAPDEDAMITVHFKQNYYPGYGAAVSMYEKGETYEMPADTPIPTRDVEILSGTSTYKKPADRSPGKPTQV